MKKELKDLMDQHSSLINSIASRLVSGARMTGKEVYVKYAEENGREFGFFIGSGSDKKWGAYHCVGESRSPIDICSQAVKIEFVKVLDKFTDLLMQNKKTRSIELVKSIEAAVDFVSRMNFCFGDFKEITRNAYLANIRVLQTSMSFARKLDHDFVELHCSIYTNDENYYLFTAKKEVNSAVIDEVFFEDTSEFSLHWLEDFLYDFMKNQTTMEPKAKIINHLIEYFDTFDEG